MFYINRLCMTTPLMKLMIKADPSKGVTGNGGAPLFLYPMQIHIDKNS